MTGKEYAEVLHIRLKLEEAFKAGNKESIDSLYRLLLERVDRYNAHDYDVADLNKGVVY